MRSEEGVTQGAVVECCAIAPLAGTLRENVALQPLNEACRCGDGQIGGTAQFFAVRRHGQLCELSDAGGLRDRRLSVKATDWPCRERDRARWRAISPTSRCAVVSGHPQFRETDEIRNRGIEKCGDLRESAGEVTGTALRCSEAAGNEGEEPAADD